jgi:hypothetical protein
MSLAELPLIKRRGMIGAHWGPSRCRLVVGTVINTPTFVELFLAEKQVLVEAMLRFPHSRAGYTRLDTMPELERRLVRKLGMYNMNISSIGPDNHNRLLYFGQSIATQCIGCG